MKFGVTASNWQTNLRKKPSPGVERIKVQLSAVPLSHLRFVFTEAEKKLEKQAHRFDLTAGVMEKLLSLWVEQFSPDKCKHSG